MRIDTKYTLEQEVGVVYKGIPRRGVILGCIVHCDLRFYLVEYEVRVFDISDNELGIFKYDENHVFKNRTCNEILIELALQNM